MPIRGLHSSNSQLNLSHLVHHVTVTPQASHTIADVELKSRQM